MRLPTVRRLPFSVSLLALAIAAPQTAFAQAQETPAGGLESSAQDDEQGGTGDATAQGSPQQGKSGENILVTGSRIPRPEFSAPNPVQSFTTEVLQQSGETNLTDFLVDVPALVGSFDAALTSGSNGFFESAGLNLLNLRNLGIQRTLVLVNGRRHVAAFPGTAAIDINTIPLDLIERIDVLTGGTSAIYGADGVSGVVNFILRRDFDGIRARGQMGISEYGDQPTYFGSILVGRNFADDRGNAALSYEYSRSARLNDSDRPFSGDPLQRFELLRQGQVGSPDRPDNPDVVDRVLFNDVRWQDSSPDGAIDLGSDDPASAAAASSCPAALDGIPDFTGSGTPYDRGTILPGTGGRTIGGSGTPTAGYFGDFLPYQERHNVNALFSFEFAPAIRLFAEGKWVDTTAFTIAQPTFDFFTFLAEDNAFLLQRFGALGAGGALSSRDNLDFGIRGDRSRRRTLRGVIGLDGELSDHLRYEAFYLYGRTRNLSTSQNDRIADRYYAALDAVVGPNGQITCRINLPGQTIIDPNNWGEAPVSFNPGECVPLNILGYGVASPAALDFVLATHTNRSTISHHVAGGHLAGDLGGFFELPGGPIGFAVGVEYRKELSSQVPSDLIQQGFLLDSSEIEPTDGEYDVKEAFAEISIPILRDMPFAHTLSVGAAIRLSDYSTVGNTTTWRLDGIWAPIRDISFRGTWSQAVRAPNIGELFSPLSGTFQFITDPCDLLNINSGSSTRQANCVAQLSALGLTPAEIAAFSPGTDPEASTSQLGLIGGNPDLREETARTWTVGGVLRPRFLPGFSLAADWYDIRLEDAINTFTATEAFSLCVDQPTLDNVFCEPDRA